MKTYLLNIILFLLVLKSIGQPKDIYHRELKSFLKFIRFNAFNIKEHDSLFFSSLLDNKYFLANCNLCLNKPFFFGRNFNDSEVIYVYQQKCDTIKYKLAANVFDKAVLIDTSTLEGKKQLYQAYEKVIYFSKPVFLQNYHFCIFSWSYNDNTSITNLYEKKNGKWQLLKRLAWQTSY
jgi:hypothetical protein